MELPTAEIVAAASGRVSYQGLDDAIIERSDSQFPQATASSDDGRVIEPLPLVSFARWFELLAS